MVWVGLALAEWELPRPVVGADAAPSVVDWDARARETVVGEGNGKSCSRRLNVELIEGC